MNYAFALLQAKHDTVLQQKFFPVDSCSYVSD